MALDGIPTGAQLRQQSFNVLTNPLRLLYFCSVYGIHANCVRLPEFYENTVEAPSLRIDVFFDNGSGIDRDED